MCIRDSLEDGAAMNRRNLLADALGGSVQACQLPPVSYTHLDVYKRQVLAPVVRQRKGTQQKELDAARRGGYSRVRRCV